MSISSILGPHSHDLLSPHGMPGKEPFLGQSRHKPGAWRSEPSVQSSLSPQTVSANRECSVYFPLSRLERFPSAVAPFPWSWMMDPRRTTIHPTSVSPISQAPCCFEVFRISVLSACGHNIQYINTHWRQFCLLENQVLQGYKSHLIPCKAQDTSPMPRPRYLM